MSWADLSTPGVRGAHSAVESDRFGLRMARVTVGLQTPDAAECTRAALRALPPADVVVVRWPSVEVAVPAVLAEADAAVLSADTLVYWSVPSSTLAAGASNPDVAISAPSLAEVVEVTADSFEGYPNHYAANPLLDRDLARAGYVDWAARSAQSDPASVLGIAVGGQTVGVATTAVSDGGDHLEILLAGLIARAHGHGWYAALLAALGARAVALGAPTVVISTQASNIRVQRAWAAAGFRPMAAFTTAHLVLRELWLARR